MRWGIHQDEDVCVFWPPLEGTLNCHFSDLFSNDLEVNPPFPDASRFMNAWRLVVLPDDDISPGFDRISANCPVPFNEENTDGRHIDFAYNRIPESLKNIYRDLFGQLVILPSLSDRVDAFAQHFNDDTVSVQIRSWPDDPVRHNALFNMDHIVRELDRLPADAGIFLSTDTDDVVTFLSSKYPDRVMTCERSTSRVDSRYVPMGVQEDLVELLLLARNRKLIGSSISTFSEVAWWLGGCQADVVIV